MATRDVFSAGELARLRGFPEITRAELIRYFTLTGPDVAFLRKFRSRVNVLGAGVHYSGAGIVVLLYDHSVQPDERLERVRLFREQGRTPKQVARALGISPAEAGRLVRAVAAAGARFVVALALGILAGSGHVPCLPGPAGEVGAGGESVRVLGAQDPFLRREQRGVLVADGGRWV